MGSYWSSFKESRFITEWVPWILDLIRKASQKQRITGKNVATGKAEIHAEEEDCDDTISSGSGTNAVTAKRRRTAYYILVKDKGKLDYKGDGCQATISSKGRAAFIQTTNDAEATVNTNNMTLKVTTAKKSDQNSDPAAAAGKEAHGFVAAGDSEMNITATNLKAQADDATGKDLVSVFTMEDKGKISLKEKNARLRVGEGEVERNVDWNVTNKVSNDEKLQEDQSLQENELQTNDTTEGEPAVVKSEYWTTH